MRLKRRGIIQVVVPAVIALEIVLLSRHTPYALTLILLNVAVLAIYYVLLFLIGRRRT